MNWMTVGREIEGVEINPKKSKQVYTKDWLQRSIHLASSSIYFFLIYINDPENRFKPLPSCIQQATSIIYKLSCQMQPDTGLH